MNDFRWCAEASNVWLTATLQDTEVFYDLKKQLEESGSSIPPQLANHEAARIKPGGVDARPRREQILYAK